MTKILFVQAMAGFRRAGYAYIPEYDQEFIDLWYGYLKIFNLDVFKLAVADYINSEETFPSIAKLKKYCVRYNLEKTMIQAEEKKQIGFDPDANHDHEKVRKAFAECFGDNYKSGTFKKVKPIIKPLYTKEEE